MQDGSRKGVDIPGGRPGDVQRHAKPTRVYREPIARQQPEPPARTHPVEKPRLPEPVPIGGHLRCVFFIRRAHGGISSVLLLELLRQNFPSFSILPIRSSLS